MAVKREGNIPEVLEVLILLLMVTGKIFSILLDCFFFRSRLYNLCVCVCVCFL